MEPFPSPQEIAFAQQRCREAYEKSRTASGLEKMRLISEAFPYAVNGGEGGLRLSWKREEKSWAIADSAGFITLIPEDDMVTLCVALGMEYGRAGSFRELVTGKKRRDSPKSERFGKELTLDSLGLRKRE